MSAKKLCAALAVWLMSGAQIVHATRMPCPEPNLRAQELARLAGLGSADIDAEWQLLSTCMDEPCAQELPDGRGPWTLARDQWAELSNGARLRAITWVEWSSPASQWVLDNLAQWAPSEVWRLRSHWWDIENDRAEDVGVIWLQATLASGNLAVERIRAFEERNALRSLIDSLNPADPAEADLLRQLSRFANPTVSVMAAAELADNGDKGAQAALAPHLDPDGSLPIWITDQLSDIDIFRFHDPLWVSFQSADPVKACLLLERVADYAAFREPDRMAELLRTSITELVSSGPDDWSRLAAMVAMPSYSIEGQGITHPDAAICRFEYTRAGLTRNEHQLDASLAQMLEGHGSPAAHWMRAQLMQQEADERIVPTIAAFAESGEEYFVLYAAELQTNLEYWREFPSARQR